MKRFFFDFFAREKTPKSAKAGYHGQFEFHVKKKTLSLSIMCIWEKIKIFSAKFGYLNVSVFAGYGYISMNKWKNPATFDQVILLSLFYNFF